MSRRDFGVSVVVGKWGLKMGQALLKQKTTKHQHIVRNPEILTGEPIIDGTRTPVRSIVLYHKMGLSADEILGTLPYLTPAQVYDALAYYYDSRKEIDTYIRMNSEEAVKKKFPPENLRYENKVLLK